MDIDLPQNTMLETRFRKEIISDDKHIVERILNKKKDDKLKLMFGQLLE